MAYDDYGPDTEMSESGKGTITTLIAHAPCKCASLSHYGVSGGCTRCNALDYIKQHWPWWYFTVIGNMGANNES